MFHGNSQRGAAGQVWNPRFRLEAQAAIGLLQKARGVGFVPGVHLLFWLQGWPRPLDDDDDDELRQASVVTKEHAPRSQPA